MSLALARAIQLRQAVRALPLDQWFLDEHHALVQSAEDARKALDENDSRLFRIWLHSDMSVENARGVMLEAIGNGASIEEAIEAAKKAATR
jgi:uncharacterized membrane protein